VQVEMIAMGRILARGGQRVPEWPKWAYIHPK
jgi:hypothetical protein